MDQCCVCGEEISKHSACLQFHSKNNRKQTFICADCKRQLAVIMDGAEEPEKTPVFWLICLRISGWLLFLCAVIIGLAAGIPIIKRNALNGWLIICMAVMIGLAALAVMQVLPHMAADMRKHSFDLGKQKKRG